MTATLTPPKPAAPPLMAVRILLVADTVIDPLVRLLGGDVAATVAPYNQVRQTLLAPIEGRPDVLLVWTTPSLAVPAFGRLLRFEPHDLPALLAEVDDFAAAVLHAAAGARFVFVTSWALPPYRRWVAAMAMRHEAGAANVLMRMNLRLAERLAPARNVVLLDVQHWQASLGRPAHDPKLHAMAQVHHSRELFARAASEIKAVYRGLTGQSRKLVICDLDNTLWGGVVGDDGMENLQLGGHDAAGQSFAAVQRELQSLQRRGVLLAVCSKNDPRIALDAISRHPEMVLRRDDFAAVQIGWGDKGAGVAAILRELNLLPSSAVFLDDHPAERALVRQTFPEVLVPELPEDVSAIPSFIAAMDCFETADLTAEDAGRTDLYRQEAQRRGASAGATTVQQWLDSLDIRLTVRPLDRASLPRAAQLLNKTNQFNMAGRRLGEAELWDWCAQPGRTALLFSVADKFGDAGATGLVTASTDGDTATLVDLVMSCRVMGKGIEQAMLSEACRAVGARTVFAPFVVTEKNGPCRQFLEAAYAEPPRVDLSRLAAPAHVAVQRDDSVEITTREAGV
jgi:FkbH-like protein